MGDMAVTMKLYTEQKHLYVFQHTSFYLKQFLSFLLRSIHPKRYTEHFHLPMSSERRRICVAQSFLFFYSFARWKGIYLSSERIFRGFHYTHFLQPPSKLLHFIYMFVYHVMFFQLLLLMSKYSRLGMRIYVCVSCFIFQVQYFLRYEINYCLYSQGQIEKCHAWKNRVLTQSRQRHIFDEIINQQIVLFIFPKREDFRSVGMKVEWITCEHNQSGLFWICSRLVTLL